MLQIQYSRSINFVSFLYVASSTKQFFLGCFVDLFAFLELISEFPRLPQKFVFLSPYMSKFADPYSFSNTGDILIWKEGRVLVNYAGPHQERFNRIRIFSYFFDICFYYEAFDTWKTKGRKWMYYRVNHFPTCRIQIYSARKFRWIGHDSETIAFSFPFTIFRKSLHLWINNARCSPKVIRLDDLYSCQEGKDIISSFWSRIVRSIFLLISHEYFSCYLEIT